MTIFGTQHQIKPLRFVGLFPCRRALLVLQVMLLLAVTTLWGARDVALTRWLICEPLNVPFPALAKQDTTAWEKEYLNSTFFPLNREWPTEGDTLHWFHGQQRIWREAKDGGQGITLGREKENQHFQLAYLTTYVTVTRYVEGKLKIKASSGFRLWLDGQPLEARGGDPEQEVSAEFPFSWIRGTHRLQVQLLRLPGSGMPWKWQASLQLKEAFSRAEVHNSIVPRRILTVEDILAGPQVSAVGISADGTLTSLVIKEILDPTGKAEEWVEIRRTRDGRLLHTLRDGQRIQQLRWAPVGRRFAYITQSEGKTTLWLMDWDQGAVQPLLRDVEHFDGYQWAPTGDFLVYRVQEPRPEFVQGSKRWESLRDRWPWFRKPGYLYRLSLPDGAIQRLTAGPEATRLLDIRADGKALLFERSVDDYQHRPFVKSELYELDLLSLQSHRVLEAHWLTSATYSPDGQHLLLVGGPSLFGATGINVPPEVVPNEYDHQLYLLDVQKKQVRSLTRTFRPSVKEVHWSVKGNQIYFTADQGQYRHFYRLDPGSGSIQRLPAPLDVVEKVAWAAQTDQVVFTASGAAEPPRAYLLDLPDRKFRLLHFPDRERFRHVQWGKMIPWFFVNSHGDTIDGRIHLPPHFDSRQKYPCIFFYYGGVYPTQRDFGGRYPKNLFAAHGYVVLTVNPRGTVGYGQRFSAWHVDDWGNVAAQDLLEGIQAFLQQHPFVDSTRVGIIGASYGGFLTQRLLTLTDRFACGISHAGISAIPSYWGEGYWGYIYTGIVTNYSFPWNRRDIFVDRSPLFLADRIRTPLLLLHGVADTNVPRGESDQLFTALKLLDRPVEYVQIAGQNHWILDYPERVRWQHTILAWFDRWLKNQPEWWQALYEAGR